MAQFGEILAELRQDKKLTQKELAKAVFVTPGTISNYENGVHFPDVEKLIVLADFFHVSTDYLLGRSRVPFAADIFDETVINGKTVGAVIHDIRSITVDRKRTLVSILNDMKLGTMIKQYDSKEKS